MRAMTLLLTAWAPVCSAHGHLTWPPSRHGGTLQLAGDCKNGACLWFSQPAEIPGEPTLNDARYRSYNINVSSGPRDWSRKMPWRAPGAAPVFGSGCGSAGGGPVPMANGGNPPPGIAQGFDAVKLPVTNKTVWRRGAIEEVAWSMIANHGGGYSYRLCKAGGDVSENCFQRTVLRFATNKQWIQYADYNNGYNEMQHLPRFEMPLTKVTTGTYPNGSEWARNPVPGCLLCDQADCTGSWAERQHCAQTCSGLDLPLGVCPPGMTQFPEPLHGISGYDPAPQSGFPYSIVDKIVVPADLEAGDYLLSWRWDCEQSRQIWQNCADISIQ